MAWFREVVVNHPAYLCWKVHQRWLIQDHIVLALPFHAIVFIDQTFYAGTRPVVLCVDSTSMRRQCQIDGPFLTLPGKHVPHIHGIMAMPM
jgi:hypothetical protein